MIKSALVFAPSTNSATSIPNFINIITSKNNNLRIFAYLSYLSTFLASSSIYVGKKYDIEIKFRNNGSKVTNNNVGTAIEKILLTTVINLSLSSVFLITMLTPLSSASKS
ncbi:hypothetical protein [Borrelia persica]|uniref:hypothetical protein n=1 Tax=Borrelia persica TaxID=44448 RepID=UPI000467BB44|nr:hypothetical protein [Borrelia persica]